MGLSAEESQYILRRMLDEKLEKKASDAMVKDVRAKRWVRLNAVAYLAHKLDLSIESNLAGSESDDEEEDGARSKKRKSKKPAMVSQVTNHNMGHFLAALQKRKERAL